LYETAQYKSVARKRRVTKKLCCQSKGEKMANKRLARGMLVSVLVFGFVFAGCATASSIGGTADAHGLISKAKVVSDNAQEIASYSVILGLVDSGYEAYAASVQEAEASGKKVTTVTKWLVFLTKTTAYAK
jgi:hypothetical protein